MSQTRLKLAQRELEEFRSLMEVPSTFEEGFTWTSFLGTLFVALVMVPGALYMTLVAGQSIGPAAQWVTVILFIEVARRANRSLKRAEIYMLFYLAAAAMAGTTALIPRGTLLWKQFYAQSTAAEAAGITEYLPTWFAPTDPNVLARRTIFAWEWLPAIGLLIFGTVMSRLNNTILGYGLFRLASDIEKLPFPLAPVQAQGVLALSEEQEEENANRRTSQDDVDERPRSWRWRVFSTGSIIGLVFGSIYIGIPTVTGALLGKPIIFLPIPFVDWTAQTGQYLPAVATGLSLDLAHVVYGMVLPFWSMLGSLIGFLSQFIANPMLYDAGILHSWRSGQDTVSTIYVNQIDFYFSFQIGLMAAVALVGLLSMVKLIRLLRRARRQSDATGAKLFAVPAERGDIRFKLILIVYFVATMAYILVSGYLIQWDPKVMIIMMLFGFVYTPLISYATARLEGLAGQVVTIPMVQEAAFILSGYKGVSVWFLPMPTYNYGVQTVQYRAAELTGTRFWSIWKAELLLAPIIIATSLLFANFIWMLGPVPGPQYPYAQEMWELHAAQDAIIHSSTLPGQYSIFQEALNFKYIGWGMGIGLAGLTATHVAGLPSLLFYGIVRGVGQTMPHAIILNFIGALLGRYYFRRKMGLLWRQYVPVVAAGYYCGVGLVGTFSIGVTFLMKSVFDLPF